jgi:hypothetical protein
LFLTQTLLGTLLVASGAGALNQYFERGLDAQMKRTARRPVPRGKVKPLLALGFGILLAIAGVIYLAVAVNGLAALLAVATLAGYLCVYTPLKRITAFCTLAGAVPGAMPPLIGWAAASGSLSYPAWLLYFTLFLWQFPHFMAIAWMYREDYSRAGYPCAPAPQGRSVHLLADRAAFGRTGSSYYESTNGRRRGSFLYCHRWHIELGVLLLQRASGLSRIQIRRASNTDGVHPLPSPDLCCAPTWEALTLMALPQPRPSSLLHFAFWVERPAAERCIGGEPIYLRVSVTAGATRLEPVGSCASTGVRSEIERPYDVCSS